MNRFMKDMRYLFVNAYYKSHNTNGTSGCSLKAILGFTLNDLWHKKCLLISENYYIINYVIGVC